MKNFFKFYFLPMRYMAESLFKKTIRVIWNKGIKLQWNRLWIRKDEFHSSLEMDCDAMLAKKYRIYFTREE